MQTELENLQRANTSRISEIIDVQYETINYN